MAFHRRRRKRIAQHAEVVSRDRDANVTTTLEQVAYKLMLALGYNEYVAQGGDWGSWITRATALQSHGGKHVKAWHTNMPVGLPPPITRPVAYLKHLVTPYTAAEKAALQTAQWFDKQGRGYYYEQATQPQTLGYSLADSRGSAGLRSCMSGVTSILGPGMSFVTKQHSMPPTNYASVLAWISMYWFSRAGPTASLRIYYETYQSGDVEHFIRQRHAIPMGISVFPAEPIISPLSWYRSNGNIVFSNTAHTKGDHFAVWETQDALVKDLHKMFGKGGPALSVVPGKTGYD